MQNRQSPSPLGSKPVIALTMGEPAGIGPELCLMMLSDVDVLAHCQPVFFGDARLLQRVARTCGLPPSLKIVTHAQWLESPIVTPGMVVDVACADMAAIIPGKTSATGGRAAYLCLETATREAMAGRVAAVVTAPLSKASLNQAGVPFPGHTEILAHLTGTRRYCMMLASERITTSLVTTHTALANVPAELSVERILNTIQLTDQAMARVRHSTPRIVVCALNPHAGEQGLFGVEEQVFIEPAIQLARQSGIQAEGPLPPDTAFLPERLTRTDAYVCMYHDQGLIPFKMLSFDVGVNVTLGLPIVRTSPDHGTAFDLAWSGRAKSSSMREAVLYAVRLCGVA